MDHPIIDADGHAIEYLPYIYDLFATLGGAKAVDGFRVLVDGLAMIRSLSVEDRVALRRVPHGLVGPGRRRHRPRQRHAAEAVPRAARRGSSLDLAIVHPTYGLLAIGIHDPDVRIPVARAFNRYYAEQYAPYGDRILPAATIPVHTPDEAVAELDYAIRRARSQGRDAERLTSCGRVPARPIRRGAHWVDTLGLNSAHDYDPLWRRCARARRRADVHALSALGLDTHESPGSYVYNKLGSFAGSLHALCRSLVLGGVLHRFPSLHFAFLEGGAGWAAMLYADLLAHWAKRNAEAVRQYDPRRLDRKRLRALFEEHGSSAIRQRLADLDDCLHPLSDPDDPLLDDFGRSGIGGPDDVRRMFAAQLLLRLAKPTTRSTRGRSTRA